MTIPLLIYGAGDTGIALAEWIRQEYAEQYRVEGFLDDYKISHDYPIPIVGSSETVQHFQQKGLDHLILGFVFPVERRLERAKMLRERGFHFPSLVPENIQRLWNITIGEGVLIYQSSIYPQAKIGDFVGINAFTNIELCVLEEGVIVTPHVCIGTGCHIGKGTILYPHATVEPYVEVGEFCVIGCGAVVHKNLKDKTKYLRANHIKEM